MACNQPTTNTTATTAANSRGFIYETLQKIDQLQKAASIQTACEGCEGSLLSTYYNTKPISIYMRGGTKLRIDVPDTTNDTDLFRIESIRNDSVVLRLLLRGEVVECTNYTAVVNIDCICSLQCLAPICCEECTRPCGV